MHVDEEEGLAAAHPLPGDRARRQPRRLGRAAAADRPHPPAARPHGGDRPSDRRRRQIWRPGRVPDRIDQPQAPPPRAAAADRPSRRRPDRRHRRACPSISPTAWPLWASTPRSATCRSTRSNSRETPEGKRKAAIGRRQGPPQGAQGRAPQPGQGLMHPNRDLRLDDRDGDARLRRRHRLLHDLRAGRRPAGRPRAGRRPRAGPAALPRRPRQSRRAALDGARALALLPRPRRLYQPGLVRHARPGADLELLAVEAEGPLRRLSTRRNWPASSTISAPRTRRGSRPSRPGPAPR